jgi:hypothetical protein
LRFAPKRSNPNAIPLCLDIAFTHRFRKIVTPEGRYLVFENRCLWEYTIVSELPTIHFGIQKREQRGSTSDST